MTHLGRIFTINGYDWRVVSDDETMGTSYSYEELASIGWNPGRTFELCDTSTD